VTVDVTQRDGGFHGKLTLSGKIETADRRARLRLNSLPYYPSNPAEVTKSFSRAPVPHSVLRN